MWGKIYIADPKNVKLCMVFLVLFLCWVAVGFVSCSSCVVFCCFLSRNSRNSYSLEVINNFVRINLVTKFNQIKKQRKYTQ